MNRIFKKLTALFLVLGLVMGFFPAKAYAEAGITQQPLAGLRYYDDRYDFQTDYPGYTVALGKQTVNSFQVDNRIRLEQKDEAVLTLEDGSETAVRATGTGTAEVLLTHGREQITLLVTIEPAPLTLMFLTGQSNMEGSCSANVGCKIQDSVLCPEGQVYSTYFPSANAEGESRSLKICGLDVPTSTNELGVLCQVPYSLTDDGGNSGIVYPLNALTAKGLGKTGPDSGLAYEWNRLTGQKVWVVNAAYGSSYSSEWKQSGSWYKRAANAFKTVLQVASAEVKAKHYTLEHKLLFWLQGETETGTAEEYLENLRSMYQGYEALLGIEQVGIIAVRGHKGDGTTSEEQRMTAPRIAQYYAAWSAEHPKVHLVSSVNEGWGTDAGVAAYFSAAYPQGSFSYPLRSNHTANMDRLPTTVLEVHGDIHYAQAAHNENGITAARGMLQVIHGAPKAASARWRDAKGGTVTKLELKKGDAAIAVPEASPVFAGKGLTCQVVGSAASYDPKSGTLTALSGGTATLNAVAEGKVLASLKVTVSALTAPTLKSLVNTAGGIKLSWSAVPKAQGYRIYRMKSGGSYTCIAAVTGTAYTDTTATNGTAYTYTIRPYTEDDLGPHPAGKTIVRLTSVSLTSLKNAKGKKLTVSWKKNAKASGYQLQYSLKSSFSGASVKTVSGASSLNQTLSGLKKGKTYYVRVRAFKTLSGVKHFSGWSGSKQIKITK